MHYSVIAIITLVSSVFAIPFDSFRPRDVGGFCSKVGDSCPLAETGNVECCEDALGFAHCSGLMIQFVPCSTSCTIDQNGFVECL